MITKQTLTRSDAVLEASRRVDWRFLLPDPNLGRVAYLGVVDGPLVESLRLFSFDLTVFETGAGDAPVSGHFDVAVASRPSYRTLRSAADLLRPGGFLYVESHHWKGSSPFSWASLRRTRKDGARPCYPHHYISTFEQLGFREVEAYWHCRDFAACTRIIPLQDPAALLYGTHSVRGKSAGRCLRLLVRLAVQSGILMRTLRRFSVVAQRSGC
ncbi:MAG: hypothetical protein ACE5JX_00080 [Acidobacteriota bacterium]